MHRQIAVESYVFFFPKRNRVLQRSSGLYDVGDMQWELVGALAISYALVFLCIFKGVQSSGKVVWFTATSPFVMLAILLVRGVTLPGAGQGLLYYITPDFTRLKDSQVCAIIAHGAEFSYFSWFFYYFPFHTWCTVFRFSISRFGWTPAPRCSTRSPAPSAGWSPSAPTTSSTATLSATAPSSWA